MQKEKLVKENKGITLIALVITIIVMMILVGVTISVSLNGGLFTTAKEATGETQIAQEKEELLMAALGALNENGKVDLGKLDSSLPERFTGSNGEYTSKTGNVFKVSENGSIILDGKGSSEEEPETPPSVPEGLINFTINGETYYAEPEMLWSDWLQSTYKTIGLVQMGDTQIVEPPGPYSQNKLRYNSGDLVLPADPIVSDASYLLN